MSNFLSPLPRHLITEPFTYEAPLRAPSPLSLTLPKPRRGYLYSDSVWNASLLLADALVTGDIDVCGKRVLELGCGVGLPGILSAKKGAELVVLTDYDDPDLLEEVRRGVNVVLPASQQSNVQVIGHIWGQEIEKLLNLGPFDLIFASDLIWQRPAHSALISTLVALLDASPSATIHLTAGFHSGKSPVRAFFADAKCAGLELVEGKEPYEISVTGERREWCSWTRIDEREMCQEERNRWTLVAALRRGW